MNFRFVLILLQNVHEFSPFSSPWECMAQCISPHNFMPDLDEDLEVGSFNFVVSGQNSLLFLIFTAKKNGFINLIIITDTSYPPIHFPFQMSIS